MRITVRWQVEGDADQKMASMLQDDEADGSVPLGEIQIYVGSAGPHQVLLGHQREREHHR